MKAIAI